MIMGVEIAIFVLGIYTLIKGHYNMGKGKKVFGPKSRVLGFICLAPLPLSMAVGFAIGLTNAFLTHPMTTDQFKLVAAGIEIVLLIITVIVLTRLAKSGCNPII